MAVEPWKMTWHGNKKHTDGRSLQNLQNGKFLKFLKVQSIWQLTVTGWWLSKPTPLKNDGVSSSVGMIYYSQLIWKVIKFHGNSSSVNQEYPKRDIIMYRIAVRHKLQENAVCHCPCEKCRTHSGKWQQTYSTRLKKELLDKPPTGPHLQREPQIVQCAEKPHCSGGRQGSKAKG